ncbi:DNA repair exonuclease [Chelativorans sp. SCAU2101]|uniref:DNA repair exonuclease n=1 Tax=Chelativorans petroleitrophicus TaxID=2975484 RepID=A0A9X3BAL4_9HYPH|nr:DNA repair exonuclease [Chelativorans petroleitrophicus]MCT8992211.1 DNA repair exonuclease [Chelativorans petroleitrophicus]
MAYRFVHAADIHLDSPLRSLALRNPELAEMIGNATRQAFVRIVDLCLREAVDALLLAGDLYDGEQTSMKTAHFLAEQFRRLHEADILVFIIRGNHDAVSQITKELSFPDTVKVFEKWSEAIHVERMPTDFPVVIHGLSFAEPHAPESLVEKYQPAVEGAFNIGILHTSLTGSSGHNPYAPCTLADLQTTGFQYWALGHIHKRSVYEGNCTVVMPGMPQGRDINESGIKSVSLVTVADDMSIQIVERPTSVAQFERVEVDANGIDKWPALAKEIGRALELAREAAASDHLVARVRLTGASSLAWRMLRDIDLLKAEADERASLVGRCWVEKLDVQSRSPTDTNCASGDPLLELRRLISEEVAGSEAFKTAALEAAEELRGHLPAECRDVLGQDETELRAIVEELVAEGADHVIARLHADTEGEIA